MYKDYFIKIDELILRYPVLLKCKSDIIKAFYVIKNSFDNGGKLLIAGNGGSAADAEHITAELMKSFYKKRYIPEKFKQMLITTDLKIGTLLSNILEPALPSFSLVGQNSLSTAFANDKDPDSIFAQQIFGYGKSGDVFLAISTSGNSKNIIYASVVAKALGIKVVSLSGTTGGQLANYSDVIICVPEKETYKIQELHLPIYHCLCIMLEEYFF